MHVGLFIPCFVDQFYPEVAIATLELLQKLGCSVQYPLQQTCCGQPMANGGYASLAKNCSEHFIKTFSSFEHIVSPSGSCVVHIKEHVVTHAGSNLSTVANLKVWELTEFLTDALKVDVLPASFPYLVGLHLSCHGQRMLHLSSMSETVGPDFSKAETLLKRVKGLRLVRPARWDECCGFGGTFCVTEEAVSVQMGSDRIREHEANGVEFITGGDMSCLMHLEGILRRKKSKVKVIHIAQILNQYE